MEAINSYPINTLLELPVELLHDHPENPSGRITVDDNLLGMMRSIKSSGIHEPLIVTPSETDPGKYKIICGHRRRRAGKLAGLKAVPCIIRIYQSVSEERCAMLIENIQRKSLYLSEQAEGFFLLLNGVSPENTRDYMARLNYISEMTGISPARIDTRLSIRNLIPAVKQFVDLRIISLKKAKILAGLPPQEQARLIVKAKQLSDAEFSGLVKTNSGIKAGTKHKHARRNAKKKTKRIPDRMFSPDDEFDRNEAIKSLNLSEYDKFSRRTLVRAFNDVCEETCSEAKNDVICRGCPVPRFVKSVLEREKLECRKQNLNVN